MSSPEYAELRGVSGTAVAPRAAIVDDPALRSLLWFLQAKSLEPGGLKQVAREILNQNRERVKSTMPYSGEESFRDETLVVFLTDLCVNPRWAISKSAEREKERSVYERRVESEFPRHSIEVKTADLYWFQDIVGALLEYQRCQAEAARAEFVLTDIGRKVWETLDFALKARRMVVIEGWEGRGKSEAVRAWCRMHRGEARYADLTGVTSKTTIFRAIAKALGIASSYSRTATEMQARIEEVLQRSRLVLVFDEAHFLFNQSSRIYTRPEIVDWIDTALCNHDVPVALVTTPQFINCVKRAESQVGWNWRQFRRRVRRWVQLAEWNKDADLEAAARKLMPGLSRAGVKLAVGYAKLSLNGSPSRDISGLGDVATEARLLAQEAGRDTIAFEDVERAINDYLVPSDTAFAGRMAAPLRRARKRIAAPLQAVLPPAADAVLDGDGTAEEAPIFPRHRAGQSGDLGRAVVPRVRGELVAV